jgi:hypothetical protein
VLTHWPPQGVSPPGQLGVHVPDRQTSSEAQILPHPPQLSGSRVGLTHSLPQVISGYGQETWHLPVTQMYPVPQALPQEPQLYGSF